MAKLLPKQYAKILYQLTKGAQEEDLDRIIETYVAFLKKDHALKKVDFIVKEFLAYVRKIEGIVDLEVTVTAEVSKKTKEALLSVFGSKTTISENQDASILGGIAIRAGNTVYDGTLRKQLKRLKQQLLH